MFARLGRPQAGFGLVVMMVMIVMMMSDTQRVSFTRLPFAAAPIPASRACLTPKCPRAQVPKCIYRARRP